MRKRSCFPLCASRNSTRPTISPAATQGMGLELEASLLDWRFRHVRHLVVSDDVVEVVNETKDVGRTVVAWAREMILDDRAGRRATVPPFRGGDATRSP